VAGTAVPAHRHAHTEACRSTGKHPPAAAKTVRAAHRADLTFCSLNRNGVSTVDRNDDVPRLDAGNRGRALRNDREDDDTAGAIDAEPLRNLRRQCARLNTDVGVAGGPGGQQLVCNLEDGFGGDRESQRYRAGGQGI
jgi:hypothetical protein